MVSGLWFLALRGAGVTREEAAEKEFGDDGEGDEEAGGDEHQDDGRREVELEERAAHGGIVDLRLAICD